MHRTSLNLTTQMLTITGSNSRSFSQTASNVIPGRVYYYQAVAQNGFGTEYGDILSFSVGGFGSPKPGDAVAASIMDASSAAAVREPVMPASYHARCANRGESFAMTSSCTRPFDATSPRRCASSRV